MKTLIVQTENNGAGKLFIGDSVNVSVLLKENLEFKVEIEGTKGKYKVVEDIIIEILDELL